MPRSAALDCVLSARHVRVPAAYQFGTFPRELNLARERFQLSALANETRPHEIVLQFLQPALLRATSVGVVRAGFAETAIWPFDPDKLLQNADL